MLSGLFTTERFIVSRVAAPASCYSAFAMAKLREVGGRDATWNGDVGGIACEAG
jgi:hypothetical protein